MEWTRLNDDPSTLKARTEEYASREVPSFTTGSLPFGHPKPKVVATSMGLLRRWFAAANVEIYYRGIEHLIKTPGVRNIIVPNHPHLFDSLATRYLFYLSGQFVPFTAALDTLAKVPLISDLLKDNGTFFIDTHRFSDLAYRSQVNEFMREVTDHNEWLQFYFEGNRAPHERQRVPRRGLMKALTDQPCVFYPVSISYQRIPTSYFHQVGKIYIELSPPIPYHPVEELPSFIHQVAETVQRGVVVHSTDILATLLLSSSSSPSQEEMDWLQTVLTSQGAEVIETPLEETRKLLGVNSIALTEDDRRRLRPYRERILHFWASVTDLPSFLLHEFAWIPPPPLVDDQRIKEIANGALSPLVTLYQKLIDLLDQGVTKVEELEKRAVHKEITVHTIRNTLRLWSDQGVIRMEEGKVTLL